MVEISNIMGNIVTLLITGGLIGWMYKVLNAQIKIQREELMELKQENRAIKSDFETLKQSEYKWFRKFQWIVGLIYKHRQCINGEECAVYKEFSAKAEEEGLL